MLLVGSKCMKKTPRRSLGFGNFKYQLRLECRRDAREVKRREGKKGRRGERGWGVEEWGSKGDMKMKEREAAFLSAASVLRLPHSLSPLPPYCYELLAGHGVHVGDERGALPFDGEFPGEAEFEPVVVARAALGEDDQLADDDGFDVGDGAGLRVARGVREGEGAVEERGGELVLRQPLPQGRDRAAEAFGVGDGGALERGHAQVWCEGDLDVAEAVA